MNPSLTDIRKMHDRIFVFDAHVDLAVTSFTPERPGVMGYDKLVTFEKMEQGGLDGAVFVSFVEQDKKDSFNFQKAHNHVVREFDLVHEGVEKTFSRYVDLALRPNDVPRIHSTGKKIALIGLENGYPIGTDLKNVQKFYDRGCRYVTVIYVGHNQFGSSSADIEKQKTVDAGLTELGKDVIREMNRVGMIIDVSHASKKSVLDMTKISKVPIIASHSSCRALNPGQERIMSDEELIAVSHTGGVVHIVGLNLFIKEDSPERAAAVKKARILFNLPTDLWGCLFECMKRPEKMQVEYKRELEKINAAFPQVGVKEFIDHIDYAVNLLGIDHVGISSDFFSTDLSLAGWADASETFNVTLGLVRQGYTENQIAKLWSGNFMRVWREVEERKG